jgi:hypothetical protein
MNAKMFHNSYCSPSITIDAEQLRKALADIEEAEEAGLHHCQAVFIKTLEGEMLSDYKAEYLDLIEKAHPTDGTKDWGRGQNVRKKFRYNEKTGKLEDK